MPTPTPPEAIDLLLAAGALERAAITANPARRCPLERVAAYLRELVPPIERRPVSEWRTFDGERTRALIDGACSACGGQLMPDHTVCFSAECVHARARAAAVACDECGAPLLHIAGPNYAGTICEHCNPDSSLLDDDDELTEYELDQEAAAFGVARK
jgi:hypothetical protein